MLKTIVLVCALGTDPSACTAATALDVVVAPSAGGAASCGLFGQAAAAANPVVGGTYRKIVCAPERRR